MITLYRLIVALLFYCSLPLLLASVWLSGRHRHRLQERFACYPPPARGEEGGMVVWLHAASVGEVQAGALLVEELQRQYPNVRVVLTTMTLHGSRFARERFGDGVPCLLAPLDVPGIAERAVAKIRPDVYICLETELWPILLGALAAADVRLCLANGRISERSFTKYRRMTRLLAPVLRQFDRMAVISDRDRERYLALGARAEAVAVTGNVKYDLALPASPREAVAELRTLLAVGTEEVLVAGSTHSGEDLPLARMHQRLCRERALLLVLVPRHVERVAALADELGRHGLAAQLFSDIAARGEQRREGIVIVDTMGLLFRLYGAADWVFCGGSLVDRGGHNLMEAAVWAKAVFYGPSVADFHDAAELLSAAGGAFPVNSVEELEERLRFFGRHPEPYREACRKALEVAQAQRGSGARQVRYLLGP